MKNLKKLNRNELKSISGAGIISDLSNLTGQIGGLITNIPAVPTVVDGLCQVQCVLNGVITLQLLPCGGSC
jgi:hypothetical protein